MVWVLFIIVALVAAVWLRELWSPSHRAALRFMYNESTDPASFHGLVAGDATTAKYAGDPAQWPPVTIIVPGRNEGHMLMETIGSLCRMDYPDYRIVFIDDQSTDNTKEVCAQLQAKYPHLQVIHNTQPPPDGWVGKVWAIHQAREHATTPYVMFTDSDLKYHPQCLRQMMRLALHRQTGLVSLLPSLETHTLGEKLGMMTGMKLITVFYPLTLCNDPKNPMALTAGGFLLFRRDAYEAIGGHEAVRQQVIEDIALGRLTKGKGLPVFTVATHELMSGRMYEGWRDTYHGLKKNAYAGAHYSLLQYLGGTLMLLLTGVLLPLYPILAIMALIANPSVLTGTIFVLAIIAFAAMIADMTRGVRFLSFPLYCAWLTPFAVLFFLTILTHSMLDHYFGGNIWSGRRYKPQHVEALNKTGAMDENGKS